MESQNSLGLSFAGALDFFEDGGALGLRAVGYGAEVVVGEVDIDGSDQLTDAGEAALTNDVVGGLLRSWASALILLLVRVALLRFVSFITRPLSRPANRGNSNRFSSIPVGCLWPTTSQAADRDLCSNPPFRADRGAVRFGPTAAKSSRSALQRHIIRPLRPGTAGCACLQVAGSGRYGLRLGCLSNHSRGGWPKRARKSR